MNSTLRNAVISAPITRYFMANLLLSDASDTLSAFLIDVEAEVGAVANRLVSFSGGDDDGLARAAGTELLAQVHYDCQLLAFDFHLYVFHLNSPLDGDPTRAIVMVSPTLP